jgi:hypothetical protein
MKNGDIFYHYNNTGTLYWGMHRFIFNETKNRLDTDLKERVYVELSSIDNNNNKYEKSILLSDFKDEYFNNLRDAWEYKIRSLERINKEFLGKIRKNEWRIEQIKVNILKSNNLNGQILGA